MNKIIKDPISDFDIKYYLPSAKILIYEELKNYDHIDDILIKDKDFAFILYPVDSKYNGHWMCILKYDDKIEHFDPLSVYPDNELEYTDIKTPLYLTKLYDKSKYEIVYNKFEFQKWSPNVRTCGRHSIFRAIQLKYNNLDLCGYCKLMKNLKKQYKLSFDEIVSTFINKI